MRGDATVGAILALVGWWGSTQVDQENIFRILHNFVLLVVGLFVIVLACPKVVRLIRFYLRFRTVV